CVSGIGHDIRPAEHVLRVELPFEGRMLAFAKFTKSGKKFAQTEFVKGEGRHCRRVNGATQFTAMITDLKSDAVRLLRFGAIHQHEKIPNLRRFKEDHFSKLNGLGPG